MKFNKIWIDDFRSIDRIIIDDIKPLNIFIGKNNTGKSNIIKALGLLFHDYVDIGKALTLDDVHKKDKSRKIRIYCYLSLEHWEKKNILNELKKHKKLIGTDKYSKQVMDFFTSAYVDIKYVRALRADYKGAYLGYKKITNYYDLFSSNFGEPINSKILEIFKKKFPNFTFIDVNDSFREVDEKKYNRISRILSNYFLSSGERRKDYIKLKSSLSELLEGINSEPRPVRETKGKTITYNLKIDIEDDSISLPLLNMGDGLQRIAYIFYELIFSENKIIAIEEPENGLHIGAQKKFIRLLNDIAKEKKKTVFMTTHSPLFIDENEDYNIYKTTLIENKTKISKIKKYPEIYSLSKELGLKPSDFLFSNGIIWVEGPSDKNILNEWLKTKGYDLNRLNVSTMFYGGSTLNSISLQDLKKLNSNLSLIIDSDRTTDGASIKKYKSNIAKECKDDNTHCWITERREIENYFSSNAIKKYYNLKEGIEINPHSQFDKLIKETAKNQGLSIAYKKLRDSAGIASHMTIDEIKNDFELNTNLDAIISDLDAWK